MTGHSTGHSMGRATGHLTALAATAMGSVPLASPRRRSRFEPTQDVGRVVGPPEEVVSRMTSPVRGAAAEPTATPAPGHRSEPWSRPDSARVPGRPSLADPEVAAPARRRPVDEPRPAAEPPPRDVPGAIDVPSRAAVGVLVRGLVLPAPSARGGEEPAAAEPVTAPPARRERGDGQPGQPGQPGPPAVGVLVPRPLPTTAPAPVATAPSAARRNAPSPAEPDVRVTIGRLEVRTAPTAPGPGTPESSRRAPAGLRSLEEYGAARGGGRR